MSRGIINKINADKEWVANQSYQNIVIQEQRINMLNQIDMLYDTVIKPFQAGDTTVSSPRIACYMTRDIFTQWIVDNNGYVASIIG